MKLRTSTGDVYFSPQSITHVHLSPEHSMLTVHFVDQTHYGSTAETDEERIFVAEFLAKLSDENSGFVAVGNEVLNLKSALFVSISAKGPIHVRWADNLTRSFDEDHDRIRKLLDK